MNVTRQDINEVNTIIKVDIAEQDYKDQVTKQLNNHRKSVNIPGFRKGHVPMGMIKRQYGKSIKIQQINEILQQGLDDFLKDEKINFLGRPLPVIQDDFSWDSADFCFEFELGLVPEFDINLKPEKKIVQYQVPITDKEIDDEMLDIQSDYDQEQGLTEVTEGALISGVFTNSEENIEKPMSFYLKDINGQDNVQKFIGAKLGETLKLETKDLFKEDSKMSFSDVFEGQDSDKNIPIKFIIEEITLLKSPDLDQKFFDRLSEENQLPDDKKIRSLEEFKSFARQRLEERIKQNKDRLLSSKIMDYLIDNTKFKLPDEFLQKWLKSSAEQESGKEVSMEEVVNQYDGYEKMLRSSLINNKFIADNDIKVEHKELVDYVKKIFNSQQPTSSETEESKQSMSDDFVNNILSNQKYYQNLQDRLISDKLFSFLKDNLDFETKEIDYDDFMAEFVELVNKENSIS